MDYVIQTRFQGPGFVAVPNAVAQMEISADALGVLVWLASLPAGFVVRRQAVLDRFRIGKDKWQRIARELTACGALQVVTQRGQGGQFQRSYVVQWPDPDPVAQAPEKVAQAPGPENPAPVETVAENPPENGGKPAKIGRKTRPSIKKHIKTKGARAVPSRPAGRSASSRVETARPASSVSRCLSDVAALNEFQRSRIRSDQSVLVSGALIAAGSPEMQSLRLSLRSASA